MSHLVLIGGPAGAGKSSLAWAWCRGRERSVQIELDQVRSSIVAGYINARQPSDALERQYGDAVRASCAMARSYLVDGYDVSIDDVLHLDAYERIWRPALGEMQGSVLILLPDLATTLRRAAGSDKELADAVVVAQHHALSRWPTHQRLDTTGMSVAQALDAAVRRGLLPG